MTTKSMGWWTGLFGALTIFATLHKISDPEGGGPVMALTLMWICFLLSAAATAYVAWCEEKEAEEKEAGSPEGVAKSLQVQLLHAQHELEMARIKQAMPPAPEPPKQEVSDGA